MIKQRVTAAYHDAAPFVHKDLSLGCELFKCSVRDSRSQFILGLMFQGWNIAVGRNDGPEKTSTIL